MAAKLREQEEELQVEKPPSPLIPLAASRLINLLTRLRHLNLHKKASLTVSLPYGKKKSIRHRCYFFSLVVSLRFRDILDSNT